MTTSPRRAALAALLAALAGCEDPAAPRADATTGMDAAPDDAPGDAVDPGAPDVARDDAAPDAPAALDAAPDAPAAAPNPTVIENSLPGTEAWRLARPADAHEVEGYASTVSALAGRPFTLHVSVSAPHAVRWEAYRIGHYQGRGGRLVASGGPAMVAPQPACPIDRATGAVECRWAAAFTVTPDASWVTGEYLLKLVRDDGYDWHVPLVVREAAPSAPVLFQASVNTWQAYNDWGGTSLYVNDAPAGAFEGDHAYRVSFDRPYTASDHGSGQMLWWEAYMARWLERQGYHVSYVTNVDVDADPSLALRPRIFLSVGHDEYWTTGERDALERARDAGVSLGFFTADTGTFHVL